MSERLSSAGLLTSSRTHRPLLQSMEVAVESSAHSAISAKRTIVDIETLRAISIIFVLIAHAQFFFPWSTAVFKITSQLNFGIGVDLFLVISGYVISRSFWSDHRRRRSISASIKAFWIRRFFRLWPASALAIAATVVFISLSPNLYSSYGDVQTHVSAAIASLTYWMNLWGYHRMTSGQGVTLLGHFWSLSLEEQFYLLFPLVVLAASTRRSLAFCALITIVTYSFLDRSFHSFWWWVRIDGLAWGIFIFCLHREAVGLKIAKSKAVALGAITFTISLIGMLGSEKLFGSGPLASTIATAGAALLVYVASFDQDCFQLGRRVSAALNYLGSRSYTIYLWHLLIFAIVQRCWVVTFPSLIAEPNYIVGVGMVLSLLPCVLWIEVVYRVIEVRTRNLGKRLALKV